MFRTVRKKPNESQVFMTDMPPLAEKEAWSRRCAGSSLTGHVKAPDTALWGIRSPKPETGTLDLV